MFSMYNVKIIEAGGFAYGYWKIDNNYSRVRKTKSVITPTF